MLSNATNQPKSTVELGYMCISFYYIAVARNEMVNHTSLAAVLAPIAHPKTVLNRYMIDKLGGMFMLWLCFFWILLV